MSKNRKAAAKVNEAVKAEPEVNSKDLETLKEEINTLKEGLGRLNEEVESLKQEIAQGAKSKDANSKAKK